MNIEDKVLQVENLGQMSFDDVLSLYGQGYRLDELNRNNIISLATCPSVVTTGGTLTLSTSVTSGTAPFTYHWSVTKPDGTIDTSLTGASNQYVFATNGVYAVSIYVTDSCTSGAKTSNKDSCVITVSPGGGGGAGCLSCDSAKNFCVAGQCIPKTYALAAGVGLVALLILKS